MKVFVFDLDGTLIDSLEDLADAVNMMLRDHGYPEHPVEAYRQFVGDGIQKLVERAVPPEARGAALPAYAADYQKYYEQTWDKKTQPYAGMVETLEELTRRGYRLAVLSNKPHPFTLKCCTRFFAKGTFDVVLGARAHVPRKPDPAGALEIAKDLGLPIEECFYVGDSGLDMTLSTNAGMVGVGAVWGFRGEAELREHGAQKLVYRPEDILALV